MELQREAELLGDRPFQLLLASRSLAVLGAAFSPIALAFAVLHLPHGGPELLSIVLACASLPMVAFMLVGGVLADRLARKLLLTTGLLLGATSFGALAAMILLAWTPTVAMGTAAALGGIGAALYLPALTGIIPEIVPLGRLQIGNAMLGLARHAAQLLGVLTAGMTVALVGGAVALIVSSGLLACASALAVFLPRARQGTSPPKTGIVTDLRDGWSEFVSHEWLWVVVTQWAFLTLCLVASHSVLGPLIADQELGGAGPWALILGGEAVGMLVGAVVGSRLRPKNPLRWAILSTTLAAPLPYFCLSFGAPVWLDILTMALAGICFSVYGVWWNTLMQIKVPMESLSRVSSYDALGSYLFEPIGLLVAGPLAVAIGAHASMTAFAVGLLIICAVALLSSSVRNTGWGSVHAR